MITFPESASVLEMASVYLDLGWSLLPVQPGGKRPHGRLLPTDEHGQPVWKPFQERRVEIEDVEAWVARDPGVNLGIIGGDVSNLAIVDIDANHGGLDSLRQRGVELPETLTAKTPNGWHAYFLGAPGLQTRAGVLPGIDIRAEGGYVVAPPSRRPEGAYEWARVVNLVPFPSALVLLQPERPATGGGFFIPADAPGWVGPALRGGEAAGLRNQTATRLAGYFHSKNIPPDIIRDLLEPYRAACVPPMDARELDRVIVSVSRYGVMAEGVGIVDPPIYVPTRMGHCYEWPSVGVSARLEGLSSSPESLTAELVVESAVPGTPRRLHGPVRVNLLNGHSRSGLIHYLKSRLDANWAELIEQAFRLTVEAYRAGEPVIELATAETPPGGRWAIEPLILADGPTIWFADGGVGKSLTALAAACAMAVPGYAFGRIAAKSQWRVLYLDWEWYAHEHRERLDGLMKGAAMNSSGLLYRRCYGPLSGQVDNLQRVIDEHGIDFVVIDSVGAACGEEPEKAGVALSFANAVRALDVGSLWLAHTTKNGGDDQDKPFGSSFWHNTARLTWLLKKETDQGASDATVGFFNKKSNTGRAQKPVGLTMTFDDGAILLTSADVLEHGGLATGVPLKDRIVARLDRGAATAARLADELGQSEKVVKTRLAELRRNGRVIELSGDRWGVNALKVVA